MTRYPVIALCGRARTGKDSAAQILLDLGLAQYRYGFADPIRAMLRAGLGIDFAAPDFEQKKERHVAHLNTSPRRLMQTLGTEWGRELVHRDIWVREAQQALMERGPGMVIADLRFENEADWVRAIDGLVVHVWRDIAPHVGAHASERGIEIRSGDAVIANNGTLAELRDRVRALFQREAA